ncbi:MAG: chemotaxis protein CheW [Lentisphaerae bacterium RIFOXYB12_FULL_65_16]|nr:MAG: chemotaxis protein CheW [Lentisphaerae bacterium RIFOXYA12_64_32]OGV93511.1 MAG: chemotaxis protein CheW [Lentisphaerae bacterium RIFOXYB12_FULL_65_16]
MAGSRAETDMATAVGMSAQAGKYLTFKLGAEEFGLEILKVQEIIKMMEITRVPRTPEFVRGVINLRGKVIPVTDLRLKFGMDAMATTDKTCVIVVQVAHGEGRVTMGIIVDEVSEVLDVTAGQIEPAPEFGSSADTEFILGMGKVGKKVVMLLDVDKVLSTAEAAALGSMN